MGEGYYTARCKPHMCAGIFTRPQSRADGSPAIRFCSYISQRSATCAVKCHTGEAPGAHPQVSRTSVSVRCMASASTELAMSFPAHMSLSPSTQTDWCGRVPVLAHVPPAALLHALPLLAADVLKAASSDTPVSSHWISWRRTMGVSPGGGAQGARSCRSGQSTPFPSCRAALRSVEPSRLRTTALQPRVSPASPPLPQFLRRRCGRCVPGESARTQLK